MLFKIGLFSLILLAAEAQAFVHISPLKPHLPVFPEAPEIVFRWNGVAPMLTQKEKVLDGRYAASSDALLMYVLLTEAMAKWNAVDSAYLQFALLIDGEVVKNEEDEVFAIVVEDQDSLSVSAAALPKFDSLEPGDSPLKEDRRVIYDCDISISNHAVAAQTLLRTLVHELGHCVGLGHPHSNYKSIMSYSNISDSAELALDDKAGITYLYPEPDIAGDVEYLTSCGTVGGRGASPVSGLLLALPFVPLLGAALSRFRRKRKRTA